MTNQNKKSTVASKRKRKGKAIKPKETVSKSLLDNDSTLHNRKYAIPDWEQLNPPEEIMRINKEGELTRFADFPLEEVKKFFSKIHKPGEWIELNIEDIKPEELNTLAGVTNQSVRLMIRISNLEGSISFLRITGFIITIILTLALAILFWR